MYVLITGASRGIGLALAKTYASHKFDLILTCKNNIEKLNDLKIELNESYGVNVITKKGNIDDKFLSDIDDIYILINNASICQYKMLIDTTVDDFNDMIYNNLTTTFLTTKAVLPKMIKKKQGIIVNISSVWGIYGSSMESIYSLTKGGINSFTKSIAKEYSNSNIESISFALGMVDTDMNKKFSGEELKLVLDTLDGVGANACGARTQEELKSVLDTLDNKKMFTKEEVAEHIYNTILNHKYNNGDIIEYNNGLK